MSVRYKNSMLGYLWSLLNPISSAVIFYVVFGVYMRLKVENYIVILLAALFPWQWFVNCVGQSPFFYLANSTLVKKVAFPRALIPLVAVLRDMLHFLIALPVYLCFMFYYNLYPNGVWLYGLPMMLLLTLGMIYGISLFIASVNLFFRDLGNLVSIILNLVFYTTPIMYTISLVPEKYLLYFKLHPTASLFICWRSLLAHNTINMEYLPAAFGYTAFFLIIGGYAYHVLSKRFAEVM
jgi:lipopolysaccharide transport system permease protein